VVETPAVNSEPKSVAATEKPLRIQRQLRSQSDRKEETHPTRNYGSQFAGTDASGATKARTFQCGNPKTSEAKSEEVKTEEAKTESAKKETGAPPEEKTEAAKSKAQELPARGPI